MIASLRGILLAKYADRVIVEVAGVGYEAFLATDAVARLGDEGQEVFLYIYTNVREDALTLFGFLELEEKELFLVLRTVSGIGPKVALAILSGMRVQDLCGAIVEGDIKRLVTLPGVGKKTAERICVELKDKVANFLSTSVSVSTDTVVNVVSDSLLADALSALTNLGYSDPVARDALAQVKRRVAADSSVQLTVEYLIREGLRVLA